MGDRGGIDMRVGFLVASALMRGDFSAYFSKVPSSLECPEPIVVVEGTFQREGRIEGEERGIVPVTVYVVREVSADAEAVAIACEQWLRGFSWEPDSEAWPWRIAGIDTSAPFLKERDSSGRFVWQFDVEVTAVRSA